jgi:hypothetical protein
VKENNDRKNPTDRQTGNKSLTESHYLGPIIDARGRDSAPFHLAIQKDPAGGRARESEKEKLLLIGKAKMGRNKVDGYDDDVPGGFKNKGGKKRSFVL